MAYAMFLENGLTKYDCTWSIRFVVIASRRARDESINVFRDTVKAARIGDKEKLQSLESLKRFVPNTKP